MTTQEELIVADMLAREQLSEPLRPHGVECPPATRFIAGANTPNAEPRSATHPTAVIPAGAHAPAPAPFSGPPGILLRLAALANTAAHFDRERERLDIELTLLRQSFPAGSEELFDQFFAVAEASSKLSAVCNSHWQQTAFAKGLKPIR